LQAQVGRVRRESANGPGSFGFGTKEFRAIA
jgi:hypothetical protein